MPRVTWYKDDEMISTVGGGDSELIIMETSLKDRGFYHCEATGRSLTGDVITVTSDTIVININGNQ